jgi:hypothetical protein
MMALGVFCNRDLKKEKVADMDDFDAKNHIRDMHRAAERRALVRMVQANQEAKPARRLVRLTLVSNSLKTFLLTLIR